MPDTLITVLLPTAVEGEYRPLTEKVALLRAAYHDSAKVLVSHGYLCCHLRTEDTQWITDRNSLGILGMREWARLWGGYVTINSTPDVGTTVTIWIPRETAPMEVGAGVTRVLVADDHATVRAGIRRFLADTPDLAVAQEAWTAPEIFEDVVFLDREAYRRNHCLRRAVFHPIQN